MLVRFWKSYTPSGDEKRALRMVDGYREAGGHSATLVADPVAAAALVRSRLIAPTTILIKASRSSALERTVELLLASEPPAVAPRETTC